MKTKTLIIFRNLYIIFFIIVFGILIYFINKKNNQPKKVDFIPENFHFERGYIVSENQDTAWIINDSIVDKKLY